MKFKEIEDQENFCEKYGIKERGGIRTSEKYPFIFLIHNPNTEYRDSLIADQNGVIVEVTFDAVPIAEENDNLKNHAHLKGVYHSVFLLQSASNTFRFLGEYEVKKTNCDQNGKIVSFKLEIIGKNGLDDEVVYFVEKDNPIELSKLTDRSDVIEGAYPEEENIVYDRENSSIQEGMYLDKDFRPIYLANIIGEMERNQNEDFVSMRFMMRAESSMAERKVAHHLYLLNEVNKEIQSKYITSSEIDNPEEIEEAFLYTVNVGCGLTNFLVKKTKNKSSVWAIDWGSGRKYTTQAKHHIDKCLDDIRNTFFSGNNFTLEKLFISHGHDDHFNKIDINMINSDTEVWMSGYHFVAGKYLNKLNQILLTGAKFKNPITTSSTTEIEILHPTGPIIYGSPAFIGAGFHIATQCNNVSPIIKIKVAGCSIISPGDIMPYDDYHKKKPGGWAWFNTSKTGSLECDFYLHSHHGSENGFITNIPTLGSCEFDTVKKATYFLSTRDNVYHGIPSGAIKSRPEYRNVKTTQLSPKELSYYKTDLLTKIVNPVF